jgi:hypothetical protein
MNELVYKLLQEIGIDIDGNNILVDQDTQMVIYFNGKKVKYRLDGSPIPIGKNDIYFDPINNVKLMNTLFLYYINKLQTLDGIYYNIFYPVALQDGSGKGYIEIKGPNTIIRSGLYFNDCLKYIDLLFRLSGEQFVDLSMYDSINHQRR